MKRILIILILTLSLVFCLPSCDKKIEENPEFARFNEMFQATFENYQINVSSTSQNGYTLNDEYIFSTVDGILTVSYTVEELNEFVIDGDSIGIPESYKTVTQGIYTAEESASFAFDIPKFNFSYTCIKSDIITPKTFSADITSLKDFMGLNVNASNAKFNVSYSGNIPNSIEISYITEENVTVVITYTFN